MSSQFKYMLDERRLRSQLREITIPLNEDAWQWFELQADLDVKPAPVRKLASLRLPVNLNLNFNKSLILPSVFGVVIIVFTLLLVNFTNIKETATPEKAQAITAVAEPVEKPAVQVNTAIGQSAARPRDEVSVHVPDIRVSASPAVTSPVVTGASSNAAASKPVAFRKKPKVVKEAEPLVTEQLPAIQPAMVQEQEEPELRP
jgi:hypothetical protein